MIAAGKRCFIHSDLGKGLLIAKRAGHKIEPRSISESCHRFLVETLNGNEDLLSFPAFNYSYGDSRIFDVRNDEVQVGQFPEWVRNEKQLRRSHVPFFSTLSNEHPREVTNSTINPFGNESHFQTLYDDQAYIIFFGADISSLTFIHFVEELSGGPLYRYDKSFPGHIVTQNGARKDCTVTMHVRPMGVNFAYDWGKITDDLRHAGILNDSEFSDHLKWLPVQPLTEFLLGKIASDPLYLLQPNTRKSFLFCLDSMERVTMGQYEND